MTPQRTISRVEFVAIIAAVNAINAAAIDVMLPALPYMGDAFGLANPNDRSLVLTVYLIGLGLPQLVFGPLIDRFGRRRPLLIGLALFSLAAFAALFAPTFTVLLALRFLQGMGAAAANVAAQSAVRDRYSGRTMAEVMSMIMSVFMIVPIIAPIIGQVILLTGPWQTIFVFMGAVGVTFLLWTYFRMAETQAPENRRSLDLAVVGQGFLLVVGNRMALFYGLASIFMFGAILGFVNSAQQIYVDIYGVGPLFPLAFAVAPLTYAIAFLTNSRLVARFGMRRLAHTAMVSYVAISGVWLAFALAGFMPLWLFIVMLALAVLMQGLSWGNIGSLAMEPLGAVAGTASAVFGALSTVGAALLAYGVAQTYDGTATPVIAAFFVFGLLVVACFLIAEGGKLFRGRPIGTAAAENPIAPV